MKGWKYVRPLSEPKFLLCIDNQRFLPRVLSCAHFACTRAPLLFLITQTAFCFPSEFELLGFYCICVETHLRPTLYTRQTNYCSLDLRWVLLKLNHTNGIFFKKHYLNDQLFLHSLMFCVFGDFCPSGMQDAEGNKMTVYKKSQ